VNTQTNNLYSTKISTSIAAHYCPEPVWNT